ncbi:MAG: FG-GAP repeat protein [Myxococcota bacterium]
MFTRDANGGWSQEAYLKASNTAAGDRFGESVTLSADGNTLAVGAPEEASAGVGVDANQSDDTVESAGAAYVFVRDRAGDWSQEAYLKASNTGFNDQFGVSVSLSGDGEVLAVGAHGEGSAAPGDEENNEADFAGAVYLFERDAGGAWQDSTYVKASNPGESDQFGIALALSDDGATLAVGASREDSNATGIDGNQFADVAQNAGAVYVFTRDAPMSWSQQAYVKASNTDADDFFGDDVALSADGDTLAVGAFGEDSQALGVGGNQADNTVPGSGAAYVFERDSEGVWSQSLYLKASSSGVGDGFGSAVTLRSNGTILAVSATNEDSPATGVGGDEDDDTSDNAGAVFVFERDRDRSWVQRSYVKAPNAGVGDRFGADVALSANGETLVVSSTFEESDATGVGGSQTNDNSSGAGAVYLY